MAYAALVSLEQTTYLLQNPDRYFISVYEKEKTISIREYVVVLLSFLEDFPARASRLEAKIRDAANETEAIIEDFMWKQNRLSWWSSIGLSRSEFLQQLRRKTEEIGSIVGEAMDERAVSDSTSAVSSSGVAVTSNNDVVIGLDGDLMAIKDRLCGESSKLQVIPIVGMGGIGKTTLARKAYDDSLIVDYFHIRAWITVSQDYSAQKMLSTLIDSLKLFIEEEVLGHKTNEMLERVYKTLKGRRYLIIMDDVWSIKVWDDLRRTFPDDGNGSRIMLTTRLLDVAAYPDSHSPLHMMRFMDDSQSWDLLKQKVFAAFQDFPSELEAVGKEIARNCGGLPLAVVVVGGILSTGDMTQASWEEIAKKVRTSTGDVQLEKILSLSYKHLPQSLRPCFLFMGGLEEVSASRLIKLWIAQGFLKLKDRYKSLEDEAEEYLRDLVKRSLVLVTKKKSNGRIKSCRLHDVVRDLCIRKAHKEKFLLHVTGRYTLPESIKEFRCISIVKCHLNEVFVPTIRSLLCSLSKESATETSLDLVENFRLLRVLDVTNNYECSLLPSQVFELFHLRYLALGYFVKIPSSISNLKNLQTLIIGPRKRYEGYPAYYSYLPQEIWSMLQLKHLVLSYYYILHDPTNGSSSPLLPLENLQTLSSVTSLVWSEKILKLIPNLKKLGIVYDKNKDYNLHNLVHLHQLEKLKITVYRDSSWLRQSPAFPPTLRKLTLYGGNLPWKDMAVVGALPHLEVLKLRFLAYDGDTWETSEGEFLQLRFLLIEESNLQHWITDTSHFPRLKTLLLHRCLDLSRIPDGVGEIPTLELIEVDDTNKSLVDSAKQIQEDQLENYGNDSLQVRCINFNNEGMCSAISPWRFIRSSAEFSKFSVKVVKAIPTERKAHMNQEATVEVQGFVVGSLSS